MKLVVGLGNPGEKYADTRHNLGFRMVEELGRKLESGNWKLEKRFKTETIKLVYKKTTEQLILAKPQTYMNNSGMAVKLLTTYYKLPVTDVIVIHDELDLPLGKIKIRIGGSSAGHRGVESVMEALANDKFIRVRLGIGTLHSQRSEKDRQRADTERFVLQPFERAEQATVKHMVKQAVRVLETILDKGVEAAQNQYH